MKSGRVWKRLAKPVCALVAVGSLWTSGGCDPMQGLLTLVQATAVGAVQETAQAAIEDAVGGILGSVTPGSEGN